MQFKMGSDSEHDNIAALFPVPVVHVTHMIYRNDIVCSNVVL